MSSRLNVRVDDALARKVEALALATGKSASSIIKAALEAYIESARVAEKVRPRLALERAGFIGCANGDPDLSRVYKQSLVDSVSSKT
jgi:metal-responsive CopG/Arc/MetJ family transcriptional regulator